MFRFFSNLLYRDRDPTRDWVADPAQLIVDIRRCTLCGVPLGGPFAGLAALGRSENARAAALGSPSWGSRGLYCTVEDGRIADFTVSLVGYRTTPPFPGIIHGDGQPLPISSATTLEQLQELLGQPFAESDADGETVLFYEYPAGEVQVTFTRRSGPLEAIELNFEPELSQPGTLEWYRIDKPFPAELRRK